MTIQTINLGNSTDGHDGDSVRTGFDKVNQNFSQVSQTFAGQWAMAMTSKDVSGNATVTLAATDANVALLMFTGTLTGNVPVVVPAVPGMWTVRNGTTGNYTLTLKTPSGTGVQVPQGAPVQLWCDGVNVLVPDAGDVILVGAGRRITGDMSNATRASRVSLQNSVANSPTTPGLVPNGTGTVASWIYYGASNPDNAPYANIGHNGTDTFIQSAASGSATGGGISMLVGGTEQLRVATTGVTVPNDLYLSKSAPKIVPNGTLTVQNSVANASTAVTVTPNGMGDRSQVVLYGGPAGTSPNFPKLDIGCTSTLAYFDSNTAGTGTVLPFVWYTGGVERMRLAPSGVVTLAGVTPQGAALQATFVSPNTMAAQGYVTRAGLSNPWGGNSFNINWTTGAFLYIDNTNQGQIAFTSDRRLKENIKPFSDSLSLLEQVNIYQFNRRTIDGDIYIGSDAIELGFMADELQLVIPSGVYGAKDAVTEDGKIQPQSLQTSALLAVAYGAVKQINTSVSSHDDRLAAAELLIAAQTERLAAFEARLAALEAA
ncbi:tail fiber domain-containing protein [Silvimonas sp.]|uniref:tail fiber domain-containing protein n=1 Tax=Silvimonas sp. TaxID=2650811 RepID=UPI00284B141C|nr:tail fiber domain-containing protein [Silvimonas sp.]MDR3427937.1 tail fiber domain-containing protein [Silvimonas sp.]